MLERRNRERVESWVSDFVLSDRLAAFAPEVREAAGPVLTALLAAACERAGGDPGDVEERHLKSALLEDLARLEIAERVARDVPALCAEFLAGLQDEGRLAGGRALGAYVRALAPAWKTASGKSTPFARAGSKVDRNGPCPCGSGLKYKKCCMRRLDRL